MNIKSIVGHALIAGAALSAIALGSATASQALPKHVGGDGACYVGGMRVENGAPVAYPL